MPKITGFTGRIIYNSRGSKTIEVDITCDEKFLGRICSPSGASVGKYEASSFPNNKPEESLTVLKQNSDKFIGLDASNLKSIHDTIRSIDDTEDYSKIGGACAFAITIAATESAAKTQSIPFYKVINPNDDVKFPFPLGNILGGGAHAGPGTPDIQESLVASIAVSYTHLTLPPLLLV